MAIVALASDDCKSSWKRVLRFSHDVAYLGYLIRIFCILWSNESSPDKLLWNQFEQTIEQTWQIESFLSKCLSSPTIQLINWPLNIEHLYQSQWPTPGQRLPHGVQISAFQESPGERPVNLYSLSLIVLPRKDARMKNIENLMLTQYVTTLEQYHYD